MPTPVEKRSIFDDISLMKREQVQVRKYFTSSFLLKLDELLDKCFLKPKEKKESFINKEKLVLEFLQLLQTQKKFKDSNFVQEEICNLSMFDRETNLIGRILNISIKNKTIEFVTLDSVRNTKLPEIKKLDKVDLFDPYSLKMRSYYEKQKQFYDCYNYKETFELVTGKEIEIRKDDTIHYSLGRGIPLDRRIQERVNNIDLPDKAA